MNRDFSQATDISSSCFVFASAGSGKTKILVDRYVKLLYSGVHPKDILCITFTNASAIEMQTRISKILEMIYINHDDFAKSYISETIGAKEISNKDIEHAMSLFLLFQDNISNLQITTIHAFCKNILQKFPIEAGIRPGFSIMEEHDSKDLLKKAWGDVLLNEIDNFEINDKVLEFDRYLDIALSDSLRFRQFFMDNPEIQKYHETLSKIFVLSQNIAFSPENQKFIDNFASNDEFLDVFLTKTGTFRKKPKTTYKNAMEILETLQHNIPNSRKQEVIDETILILSYIQKILKKYDSLKQLQNFVDFDDVLQKTEYLLDGNTASGFVLSKICSRFQAILIDEAQDLSYIQWKLIILFSEFVFNPSSTSTIFVVGDIKQSIYRFQGADSGSLIEFYKYCINIFNNLNKPLNTVYLNKSYRTLPEILKTVDSVFNGAVANFALETSVIEYKNHVAFRDSSNGSVEFIDATDGASLIAESIQTLISSHGIAESDILILTRSRDEFSSSIMKELQSRNIKQTSADRILLLDQFIIMDILAILDFCLDNNDDYSIASILKSPNIFQNPLNDEQIFKLCNNRLGPLISIIPDEHLAFFKNAESIFQQLDLIDFLKYISYKAIIKRNKSELNIIDIFISDAEKFCSKKPNNPIALLEYYRNNDVVISTNQQGIDGVRISTIHGAKGLEAPVVYLLDFCLNTQKNRTKFIWNNGKLFSNEKSLFFVKPTAKKSFIEADLMINYEYENEEKELYRLLYVAMTRARDKLFLCKNGSGAIDFIKSKVNIYE